MRKEINKKEKKPKVGEEETKSPSKKANKSKSSKLKDYQAAHENCMKKNDKLKSELQKAKKKIKQFEKTLRKINNKVSPVKVATKKGGAKKRVPESAIPAPAVAKKKAVNANPEKKSAASTKATPKAETKLKDNLKLIEGIGPAIEKHLKSVGINSFAILGETPAKKIKEILLERGGSRYSVHDPSSWARQAKLAMAGKTDELKALQEELKGGKK